jgi:integrase
MRLAKPARVDLHRRAVEPTEAVLLRHLAIATGCDPLLDEVTLALAERLGLRRIELCRLRLCDLDLEQNEIEIWGKGDQPRTMPIPPALADLARRYVEGRRPGHIPQAHWLASKELLLRYSTPRDSNLEHRPPSARQPQFPQPLRLRSHPSTVEAA